MAPDTCPLCRQRALWLGGNTLRCDVCLSIAQFDLNTHKCQYLRLGKSYSHLQSKLLNKWLLRKEVFELVAQTAAKTEPVRVMPQIIFGMVVIVVLALFVTLLGVGLAIMIRPSSAGMRNAIDHVYRATLDADTSRTASAVSSAEAMPVQTAFSAEMAVGGMVGTTDTQQSLVSVTSTAALDIEATPTLLTVPEASEHPQFEAPTPIQVFIATPMPTITEDHTPMPTPFESVPYPRVTWISTMQPTSQPTSPESSPFSLTSTPYLAPTLTPWPTQDSTPTLSAPG